MKKLMLMGMILLLMFLTACGSDENSESIKCDPSCNEWESCIEKDSENVCELKDERCLTNDDCIAEQSCNTETHICEEVVGNNCNSHSECDEGQSCNLTTHKCQECNADCSGLENSHCESEINGGMTVSRCICNEGYIADNYNCVEDTGCIDDNPSEDYASALLITVPYSAKVFKHCPGNNNEDYFKIQLQAGSTYTYTITYNSGDIYLYLLSGTNWIQNTVAFSEKDNVTQQSFTYTTQNTQIYYLVLGSVGEDYTLTISESK